MIEPTPGPWTLQDDNTFSSLGDKRIVGADRISPGIMFGGIRECKANAALVAAAPELLAACRAFVDAYERSLQIEKTDVALRLAKAAIAKAEGR